MADTPEGKIKVMVKKLVGETQDCYLFMPVQNGYGAATLDFLGSHVGRFFAIETKAPGKHMTARQIIVAKDIRAAGGAVFLIDGAESLGAFSTWIIMGEIEKFMESEPERVARAERAHRAYMETLISRRGAR